MNARRSRFLAGILATALLAPVPVWPHSDGPSHPHQGESKAAAQKPAESPSGMVRWTDANGRVHYSQGIDSVPEQFRSSAVSVGPAAAGARR